MRPETDTAATAIRDALARLEEHPDLELDLTHFSVDEYAEDDEAVIRTEMTLSYTRARARTEAFRVN